MVDYQAQYEANPDANPGAASGDNVFKVMIETFATQDRYFYYESGSGNLVGPITLRRSSEYGPDIIDVSGSYVASLGEYALDVIDPVRGKAAIFSEGYNTLINKTWIEVLSGSNNL